MNNIQDILRQCCIPTIVAPPVSHRYDAGDVRFGDCIVHTADDGVTPDIILLGVPQDIGVERNSGRTGAHAAPDAIRTWLFKLAAAKGTEQFNNTTRILDAGNIITEGRTLEEIHEAQYHAVRGFLESGARVLVFGGGHDIAYPNGMALGAVSPSIGIINFDAHLDVRPLRDGLRHSGTPFRQLLESTDIHIHHGSFIEFGIQPFTASAHHCRYVLDSYHSVVMLDDIRSAGFEKSLNIAWERAAQADAVYCTFDLDSIASAFAPGVSAPAADGFTPSEILRAARHIASHRNTRLIDIAELNPRFDPDGRTAKIAATIAAHVIWETGKE